MESIFLFGMLKMGQGGLEQKVYGWIAQACGVIHNYTTDLVRLTLGNMKRQDGGILEELFTLR